MALGREFLCETHLYVSLVPHLVIDVVDRRHGGQDAGGQGDVHLEETSGGSRRSRRSRRRNRRSRRARTEGANGVGEKKKRLKI